MSKNLKNELQSAILSPLPSNKRENLHLIEVRPVAHRLDEIVLVEETKFQIRQFLEEYAKRDQLAQFGLKPKLKILFFGPPGNGKTFCAEIVAVELGLPLLYVRFDSLITSYLGETAVNLRRVFDYANAHNGVLFLDEFDVIGKSRDDHEDVGELKRVVNSFLQLLDNYVGASPIIAATNYEKLLDYALWRRFDDLIYFPQATEPQLAQYLRLKLVAIPSQDFDVETAAALCRGLSYADVARALTQAIKSVVLMGKKKLTFEMFKQEVERLHAAYKHRNSRIEQSDSIGKDLSRSSSA